MDRMRAVVEEAAATNAFSGAVRVDVDGTTWSAAFGLADRRHGIPNTTDTRFAIASGTKGLTALVVMGLVEAGTLQLDRTARSLLGADLPLVADDVTIEHLVAHRSGIGDYLDESALGEINDHVLAVPVHQLDSAEAYLVVLDGYPQAAAPDARFAYCNGGYVLLAILAERASGQPFRQLLHDHVCQPGGMASTDLLRSDALPGDTAIGYLHADGLATNALHLPVLGIGDGGAFSTLDDVHALWAALFAGGIVAPATLATMVAPRSDAPGQDWRHGLGFWLRATGEAVFLEGYDAGVSFRSVHHPGEGWTHTTVSNWSDGAWPVTRALGELLG